LVWDRAPRVRSEVLGIPIWADGRARGALWGRGSLRRCGDSKRHQELDYELAPSGVRQRATAFRRSAAIPRPWALGGERAPRAGRRRREGDGDARGPKAPVIGKD
jgi:hypothetical protein